MTPGEVALLVAAAVLVFWMLGAYNRLVALRNAIGEAWAKVDDARRQRSAALLPLLETLRVPPAHLAAALEAIGAAHTQAERAADALRAEPVSADNAGAWSRAEALLDDTASRLFAVVDVEPELQQVPAVQQGTAAWRESTARIGFARQLYNEAAGAYDEAVGQWPTRLLVRGFGFRQAGLL